MGTVFHNGYSPEHQKWPIKTFKVLCRPALQRSISLPDDLNMDLLRLHQNPQQVVRPQALQKKKKRKCSLEWFYIILRVLPFKERLIMNNGLIDRKRKSDSPLWFLLLIKHITAGWKEQSPPSSPTHLFSSVHPVYLKTLCGCTWRLVCTPGCDFYRAFIFSIIRKVEQHFWFILKYIYESNNLDVKVFTTFKCKELPLGSWDLVSIFFFIILLSDAPIHWPNICIGRYACGGCHRDICKVHNINKMIALIYNSSRAMCTCGLFIVSVNGWICNLNIGVGTIPCRCIPFLIRNKYLM